MTIGLAEWPVFVRVADPDSGVGSAGRPLARERRRLARTMYSDRHVARGVSLQKDLRSDLKTSFPVSVLPLLSERFNAVGPAKNRANAVRHASAVVTRLWNLRQTSEAVERSGAGRWDNAWVRISRRRL
jgi:hypothetical protein